ncbi:MAG: SpoIID/LytB domain-containing protein [Candidatus Omnitrophica bacterium]|nr:SpoIID/LytB domain-containing protein [Candidatus Omnitrophota bacterium]
MTTAYELRRHKFTVNVDICFMENKIIKFILLAVVLSVFGISAALTQPVSAGLRHPYIRVAILKNTRKVVFSMRGRYSIIDPESKEVLYQGRSLRKTFIEVNPRGLKIGDNIHPIKKVRLLPSKDALIAIDKKLLCYKGAVDIILTKKKSLLVVNILHLERYVKGVLYHEVSHRWPLEALKAQAVAARTYASYQMEVNTKRDYDVTSDVFSQVYGGKSAERHRTNLAVDRTRGEVMMYNKEILPAYYHSNCGGHTEDAHALWNHPPMLPLTGKSCPYSQDAPNSQWKKNFQSSKIQKKFNDKGKTIGLIQSIDIIERTNSGRAKELRIADRAGNEIFLTAKKFRELLGPNALKSNLYHIKMKGYYFDVYGRGWGHGVGMSQWGAYHMSLKRFGYKEILLFYYPSVSFEKYR